MILRECSCPEPIPYPAPHKAKACVICGFQIARDWTSNAATMGDFYSRLAEGSFVRDTTTHQLLIPDGYRIFRDQALARERAGRSKFSNRHLARDNLVDGLEELSDFANYMAFDTLVSRRANEDPEWGPVLSIVNHAYQAYEGVLQIRRDR